MMNIEEFFVPISLMVKPLTAIKHPHSINCEIHMKNSDHTKFKKGDYIKVFGKKGIKICLISKLEYGFEKNCIYLPMMIRKMNGIGVDEYVRVQKFPYKDAKYVRIVPIDIDIKPTQKILNFFKNKLMDTLLIRNNEISINIGFHKRMKFKILEIQPTSIGKITLETKFIIILSHFQEEIIKESILSRV